MVYEIEKEIEGYEYMKRKRKEFRDQTSFFFHMLKCPKCGNEVRNRVMGGKSECNQCGNRHPLPPGWGMYVSEWQDKKHHWFWGLFM